MKGIYKVFLFCETMCECAPRLIHKTCFFFGRLLCTFVFIFVARKTDDRQRNDEEMICNFSNFSNLKIFDFLQIITFYVRKLLLKNHTFFIFSVFFSNFFLTNAIYVHFKFTRWKKHLSTPISNNEKIEMKLNRKMILFLSRWGFFSLFSIERERNGHLRWLNVQDWLVLNNVVLPNKTTEKIWTKKCEKSTSQSLTNKVFESHAVREL